jgi:hypothetical protein
MQIANKKADYRLEGMGIREKVNKVRIDQILIDIGYSL